MGTGAFGPSLVVLTAIQTLTPLLPRTAASGGSSKQPIMGCYIKLQVLLWSREAADDCSDTDLLRSSLEGPDVRTHLLRRLTKKREDHGVPRRRARHTMQTKAERWPLLSKAQRVGDAHETSERLRWRHCASRQPPLSPLTVIHLFDCWSLKEAAAEFLCFRFPFTLALTNFFPQCLASL